MAGTTERDRKSVMATSLEDEVTQERVDEILEQVRSIARSLSDWDHGAGDGMPGRSPRSMAAACRRCCHRSLDGATRGPKQGHEEVAWTNQNPKNAALLAPLWLDNGF